MDQPESAASPCAQCGVILHPSDAQVKTEGGVYCESCFVQLNARLQQIIRQQSQDIPWAQAFGGAVLGGAAGAIVWWGFTTLTHIALGLVAVVIGMAVGRGILYTTGGKRAVGLQVLSAVVSLFAFFQASYMVNRTLILAGAGKQGIDIQVPLIPENFEMFSTLVFRSMDIMDVVFMGIVVYQAWVIPAPFAMPEK